MLSRLLFCVTGLLLVVLQLLKAHTTAEQTSRRKIIVFVVKGFDGGSLRCFDVLVE